MNQETNKKVVVIGAGLSGLTLAYRLQKQGCSVTLLEKADHVGGSVGSGRKNGLLWENGPNSGMDTTPKISELLADLGISDQRIDANTIADRRFIVKGGQLYPLPMGGLPFFTTPLFSAKTKFGLFREPFIPRSSPDIDESVAGFVRRRLGNEFLDYAIDPFVSGVFAGDPELLSVQAAFPKLFALEQKYGGLIRGMILGARARKREKEKSKQNAKSFSFKDGLQTLTDKLAANLPDIQTEVVVSSLERDADNHWTIKGTRAGETCVWEADAVCLSAPTEAVAPLIAPFSEDAAAALNAISYAPVSILVSAWKRDDIAHQLDGFGFLAPKLENTKILGTLFSSSMFAYRADSDHAVLTTFIGGMRHPDYAAESDESLKAMEQGDLAALIHVKKPPVWTRIARHPRAIPQYTFGHLQRIQRVEAVKSHQPGLFFCCNWRGGISVSDCIKNGHLVADDIVGFLR